MTLFDLQGKTAIITGSSRGIGRAIAEQLAEHGARVVISSRHVGPCEEVADAINVRHPGAAIAIAANIGARMDLEALVEKTQAAFGQIDILVCNAAINPYYGPLLNVADKTFHKIVDHNILANLWLVQMTAPGMRARKDGAIIIISSVGGLIGNAIIGPYNISKAADMSMARNLAHELGPDNIRVNCIAPGVVRTEFARPLLEATNYEEAYVATAPLRRLGEPDDIAGAAVFLASRAGAWMTGQVMVICGGATV